MKPSFADIDNAVKTYIADQIALETHKELEDLIFFSSYTIQFEVFKKATQKLKKNLREKTFYSQPVWEEDASKIITRYHLEVIYPSERYAYLIQALIKSQIKINEAVMAHFTFLCKQAHSFSYLESRIQHIHALLFDECDEFLHKTSPSV